MDSEGGGGRSRKNRKAGVNPDLETLCKLCNSIDFKVVGFHGSDIDESNLFNEIRPLGEVMDEPKCSFCGKVAKFYHEWIPPELVNQPPDLKDRRNCARFELRPQWSLEVNREGKPQGRLIRLLVTLTVLKPSSEGGAYTPVIQFQKCSQAPLRVKDEDKLFHQGLKEEEAYSGRIRPLDADTRLFRKWLEVCRGNLASHPDCQVFPSVLRFRVFRLIDVEKRCVVNSEDDCSYTALSYVWGAVPLPRLTESTNQRFREPGSLSTEMLPSTIDDAIEVTRRLGEKYIWVDCLCIMQDDEADQQEFIPQMDTIFGHASVTIIAASGDNADAGLPGIKPNSRTCKQKPFTIKGVSLLRTLDPEGSKGRPSHDFPYLEDFVWCKRGWTFQEKLFSGRALIFTKEQVYWECQIASWCEDGLWETTNCPTIYRRCFGDENFRHPWQCGFETIYRKLVEEYSGRALTYESDRRHAFEGILDRLEFDADQNFLWALPESYLSNALTWSSVEESPERRTDMCTVRSSEMSTEEDEECDSDFIKLRFPSWSWLAWTGKVQYPLKLDAKMVDLAFFYFELGREPTRVYLNIDTQSLSEINVRKNTDRTDVTGEDIPESVRRRCIASNLLFFWSSTAKLHVRHGVDDPILSRNGKVVPARFWFHKPLFPPSHEELAELEFVVYGKFAEYRADATREETDRDERLLAVLLVSWEDGVAYRRGMVHIHPSEWLKLDNRVWKLISLG